uniref:Uncharacterized protein n=1 Tax=Plectus sambesii TaxID=2011161 RepID=A0A914XI30_9BILA
MAAAETMDFSMLRQIARHDLIHLLESTPGVKDLAVEPSLMKALDRIASMSLLLQHGVGKIYHFVGGQALPWGAETDRRVYLVKPTLANAKHITDHVRADPERRFTVVFVPRRLLTCDMVFEQHGVFGQLDVHEFNWSLLQLESDVLSLELPEFAHSSLVDRTDSWTHTVARSLWHLQSLFGPIPTVYGVGNVAKDVHSLTERMFSELGEPRATAEQPISHLFLLDRSLDFASALLTGLTYESMLNDMFGINCGKISFGDEVESKLKQQDKQPNKTRLLSCADPVYASVRDSHMTAVFPFLSAKAKMLQASYDKGQNLNEVKDMKHFVSNELKGLKEQHKSLELHIGASEAVLRKSTGMSQRLSLEHACIEGGGSKEMLAFMEDWMCQQLNEWQLLMLICLYSLSQNGLSAKDYQSLRAQYLQAYGHKYFLAWHSLKKVGLLIERPAGSSIVPNVSVSLPIPNRPQDIDPSRPPMFPYVAKRLNLLPKTEGGVDLKSPTEMNYVFSGAPRLAGRWL